jgi:tagatose 1,6-diphosphate aldolase
VSTWTAARARRLDQIAGPDGVVVGAAVDHRDSLRAALARKGLPAPTDAQLSALKLLIVKALAPAATVMLLDAETSAAQALATGMLPRDVALVVPLEAQGYGETASMPTTTMLPGWSPARGAVLGAAGAKLLLPYRIDNREQSRRQEAVVSAVLEGCRETGIALILEPIVYGEAEPALFSELVIAGAARLSELGPDLLKVQHPGSAAACRELDDACGRDVPWVLLGGGADAGRLEEQVAEACEAGASGFIVGRTLWDAALVEDAAESVARLEALSAPLLGRLGAVARQHAAPWRARVGEIAAPPPGTLP